MAGRADTPSATWTVVVWNLSEAQGPKAESWAMLRELRADAALLSEARVPDGVEAIAHGRTIGRDCKHIEERDCTGRPWSTAIVSSRPLREITDARASRYGRPLDIPFRPSRPGTWTAALVSIDGVGDVTVISLYGLTDEKSDASVHRSLSDLEPVFEDPRYNERLLLGGDLNIWTGRSRPNGQHLDRNQVVLERLKAHGLIDCLEQERPHGPLLDCPCELGDDCPHTLTKVVKGSTVPYQDDYLFASPTMAKQLDKCRALDPGENLPSDHSPIVATFRRVASASLG